MLDEIGWVSTENEHDYYDDWIKIFDNQTIKLRRGLLFNFGIIITIATLC